MRDVNALPFTFAGARADITPISSVPLAGSGRSAGFASVASALEANAVLLGCDGQQVLFLSADLLFFGAQLVDSIRRRARTHGLGDEHVVLTASHTHFAPATDDVKPMLGVVDPAYLGWLEGRLLELVDTVMSMDRIRVAVGLGRADTELNVNRRRRRFLPTLTRAGLTLRPSIVMAPDLRRVRDGAADVLRVVDGADNVVAVLWKFACHPVSFPETTKVSAEYPGHARRRLRSQIARDVPVVFWQGFSGDLRPRIAGRKSLRQHLHSWRTGFDVGEASIAEWTNWADRVADKLLQGLSDVGSTALSGPMSAAMADLPLAVFIDPSQNPHVRERVLRIQRIAFGEHVEAWFFSAEVCTPYFQALAGKRGTICVGYAGDVFGYLPSQKQAAEGGYEGGGYFERFGLRGRLQPRFERAVTEAVERIRSASADQSTSSSMG